MSLGWRWAITMALVAAVAVALPLAVLPLLGVGLDDVTADLASPWLLALGPAGVVLAAGVAGYLLGRREARAVRKLVAVAEQVARSGDVRAVVERGGPSEVGRLAGALADMLTVLRREREQQARILAEAGHDLRTPLTALRSNLETLLRKADRLSPAQRDELLDAAVSEVVELSEVAGVLDELGAEGQAREEDWELVDLVALAERVASRYRRRTRRDIVVVAVEDGLRALGRPGGLERAIGNLVDNAVKWGPPDTLVEVVVTAASVTVRDQGPGIPEEDLPFVFDRFYRSLEGRSTAGSGLGLAIVEHVVRDHGGEVFAENHPAGGAVVGFRLPPAAPGTAPAEAVPVG